NGQWYPLGGGGRLPRCSRRGVAVAGQAQGIVRKPDAPIILRNPWRRYPLTSPARAVLFQALVHQGDDLVQCVRLESLLAGDPADQAIDSLDVLVPTKESARRGGRFGQALGGLRVLLERNQVRILGAQALAEFPHPIIDLARL